MKRTTRTKVSKKAPTARHTIHKTVKRTSKPTAKVGSVEYKITSRIPFTYPSKEIATRIRQHLATKKHGGSLSGISGKGNRWHLTLTMIHNQKYPSYVKREHILSMLKREHPDVAFTIVRKN